MENSILQTLCETIATRKFPLHSKMGYDLGKQLVGLLEAGIIAFIDAMTRGPRLVNITTTEADAKMDDSQRSVYNHYLPPLTSSHTIEIKSIKNPAPVVQVGYPV